MPSSVEQIKAKLSVVELVGSYVKLEKAGANYRACCPFHHEKSPSFFVSPGRESYHCFGCNRGGDIFSFVQEIEGLDFVGALKLLAERTGVVLEKVNLKDKSENERLYQILELATKFFQVNIKNQPEVLAYLKNRGLTKETFMSFRIGYAPNGWRNLSDYLIKSGFTEEEMEKSGLAVKSSADNGRGGRVYDRFRGRIMFPLFNPAGKVIAFTGRIFGEAESGTAKYVNTPQTILYDKSSLLYGYDRAKQEMRQKDFCILVEGQVDLVMSHQSGLLNTVAVSGTALTERHLQLIKRLTDNIILAYDYDLAGLKASWRAINLARSLDLNVKIAKLPDGQDPADVIKNNSADWRTAIEGAVHYIDFMIDALKQEGKTGLDLTLAVNNLVLPYIKALDKSMEQAHFVSRLSQVLKLPDSAIWDDLKKIKVEEVLPNLQSSTKGDNPIIKNRRQMIEERIFGLLFWRLGLANKFDIEAFQEDLKNLLGAENFAIKIKEYEKVKNRLALEAELLYSDEDKLELELNDLKLNFKEELLRDELQRIMPEVKLAEQSGDSVMLAEKLKKCQELLKEINIIKKKYESS